MLNYNTEYPFSAPELIENLYHKYHVGDTYLAIITPDVSVFTSSFNIYVKLIS